MLKVKSLARRNCVKYKMDLIKHSEDMFYSYFIKFNKIIIIIIIIGFY